jgi:hypothetical protein
MKHISEYLDEAFKELFEERAAIYGCQSYDIARLCRFDRRALDRKCDGCPRTTDQDYLAAQGLWVEGVSHE